MRASDLIGKRLAEAGVQHAFGVPGGEILSLMESLGAAGVEYVTARHETAAGLMAEGAAVHGGGPALLVVTVGPGLSSAVNAVANALLDRVPMLVLSGSVAREDRISFTHQVFDQVALLAAVTKMSVRARAGQVDATMRRALALAMAHPRGPVHVELPVDVLENDEEESEARALACERPVSNAERADVLSSMARLLSRAERPLVIAGLESVEGVVPARLADLLDALDAPLLTTYKAKGVVDEHGARVLGAIGLSPAADVIVRPLLHAADLVLLVGYDPVEMRAAYVEPFAPGSRVLELAAVPRTHRMHCADLTACGDLADNLLRLRQRLPPVHAPRWPDRQPSKTRAELRARFAPPDPGLSPETLVATLSRVVPPGVRLTVDTGAHRILLSQAFRARTPRQVLQSNGLCTMGYALPAAIGLALATNERVVAVMGDGGFDMVAGELATLRDLALPVTLVIFDDRSLALIDLKQRAQGFPRRGVWSGASDHVAIARAYGGVGTRVHDVTGLECALEQALQRTTGFSLLSCALERGAYEGLL